MTEVLMELKGSNGKIELHEDKVVIKRQGLTAKMAQGFFKGDKTIYINQITCIELKEGGTFVNGYIQFTLPGGVERRGGLLGKDGAIKDENTVMFQKKYNEIAKEIQLYIENRMARNFQPSVNSKVDGPEAIRQYKQLCDDGIITKEEFEQKKKEILGA
jgi:Short C-terminal domain/Domain of unknown function (DUF4429)